MTTSAAVGHLVSITDWSQPLHLAFLSRRFVPRPLAAETKSEGADVGSLLIKIFPHPDSLSLGILVLPLSTLTPLYEGLSLRSLLRRIKGSYGSQIETGQHIASQTGLAEGLESFAVVAEAVQRALHGNDTLQRWLTCDMGRGEASLTMHLQNAVSNYSVAFDLTALEREEGPRVVREHLLMPLAILAGSGDQAEQQAGSRPLLDLLDSPTKAARLTNAAERLAGVSPTDFACPTSSSDPQASLPSHRDKSKAVSSERREATQHLAPLERGPRDRSPTLSRSRSPQEDRRESRGVAKLGLASALGKEEGRADAKAVDAEAADEEEEIEILNPTPSTSSRWMLDDRDRSSREGEPSHRRLEEQSPTPGSLFPGQDQTLRMGPAAEGTTLAARKDGREGRGPRGASEGAEDEEEEQEQELQLGSGLQTMHRDESGVQVAQLHSSPSDLPGKALGADPQPGPSTLVGSRQQQQQQQQHLRDQQDSLLPPLGTFESMPPTPTPAHPAERELPPTPKKDHLATPILSHNDIVPDPTSDKMGGRGTSRYTRGLAKRKRI